MNVTGRVPREDLLSVADGQTGRRVVFLFLTCHVEIHAVSTEMDGKEWGQQAFRQAVLKEGKMGKKELLGDRYPTISR